MNYLIEESLTESYSYQEYKERINQLIAEGKSTGHTQNQMLLDYSVLNEVRMKRIDKTQQLETHVIEKLQNLEKPQIWLIIAEGWCGDAAQIVPVLAKMAEQSDKIDLKIVLRDDHDALMSRFLTNGGKAIPKLLLIDAQTRSLINHWGPRPQEAYQLVENYKKEHGKIDDIIKTDLQKWYLKDKGISIQNEVIELL